eukprot:Mrub_02473.p1 GENE.Mrub_02473~~Mrub_02473.p1  ORF type:complete len:455 (+),score=125.16 Mrub_02473:248-1612(+)
MQSLKATNRDEDSQIHSYSSMSINLNLIGWFKIYNNKILNFKFLYLFHLTIIIINILMFIKLYSLLLFKLIYIYSDSLSNLWAGIRHNCVIKNSHKPSLHCWGWNRFGQAEVPKKGHRDFKYASLGYAHSCAISQHSIICWGMNDYNQCDVTDINTQLNDRLKKSQFDSNRIRYDVYAGSAHTCYVIDNTYNDEDKYGVIKSETVNVGVRYADCVGYNKSGQLEIPDMVRSRYVHSVAPGLDHTCAVYYGVFRNREVNLDNLSHPSNPNNQTIAELLNSLKSKILDMYNEQPFYHLKCWGGNQFGQSDVPETHQVLLANQSASVKSGSWYTCLLYDGRLSCFGLDKDGQSTPPTSASPSLPARPHLRPLWTAFSAGHNHNCAIALCGRLRCWGLDEFEKAAVPRHVRHVTSVAAGGNHTCAVYHLQAWDRDYEYACWGSNAAKQLEIGSVQLEG